MKKSRPGSRNVRAEGTQFTMSKSQVTARPRILVVGAGLSGLSAAWGLRKQGFEVEIHEQGDTPGGRTRSIRQGGFVFDVGAITMLPTYRETCRLVDELGMTGELHKVAPVIGIPRDGRIHRLNVSRPVTSLLKTRLIPLSSKLRLLKLLGPLRKAWNLANFQSLTPLRAWDAESIDDYLRRELDENIRQYVTGPIIRGNTLNSTADAPFGELLWMLRQYAAPYLYGLEKGINSLAERLAGQLPVTYGSTITGIEKQAEGILVTGRHGGQLFSQTFDGCVLGLPPSAVLALAPGLSARQQQFLRSIKPLPSVNVHLGLARRPAVTETFILPPESEQPDLTTIVMDHLKAPGRAPAGMGVVSLFCRDTWSARHFERPDEEIIAMVLDMARPFLGDLRPDIEVAVVQRWPYAIIKSETGLYQRMQAYEADIDPLDTVQIAGDFLSMGMEAAVISGNAAAARLGNVLSPG